MKNIFFSFLILTMLHTQESIAKKKKHFKNYFLTYNQVLALTPQLRKSYLIQMQNFAHDLDRAENKKAKKYSRIVDLFLQKAIAKDQKVCMNYGWFKERDGCNSNFAIQNEMLSVYKNTEWKDQLSCTDGASICNPALFGPGVCAQDNNTLNCISSSKAGGDGVGLKALNKMYDQCKSKSDTDLCKTLETQHNQASDRASKACQRAYNSGSYKAICLRAQQALSRVKKKSSAVGIKIPEQASPANCHYVSSPSVIELDETYFSSLKCNVSKDNSTKRTLCVGKVKNCSGVSNVKSIYCPMNRGGQGCEPQACVNQFLKYGPNTKKIKNRKHEATNNKNPSSV